MDSTTFGWKAIFMGVLAEPLKEHAFWINAMSLLIGLVLPIPLAGMLSDYIGRFKVMCFGAFGLSIVGPIGMMTIASGIASGSDKDAFCAQCVLGVFSAFFGAPMNVAWLVNLFPAKIRFTSASLGYELVSCLASAFSPLVATSLTQNHGPNAVGGIYTVFAMVAFHLVECFCQYKDSQGRRTNR
jgi:MFS family permease